MVTIREVARHARVSVGTVSNVLAGLATVRPEMRRRVEQAMLELDYHPNQIARSLKTRTTKTLGTIISDITNPFYPQLVRGAEDAALAHGYLLIMLNTDDNAERERQAMSVLRARKVDGVLITVAPDSDISHLRAAIESGVHLVALDRVPEGVAIDSVSADSLQGARMCMHHLLARGFRRIGLVTANIRIPTARARLEAYRAALTEAGIEVQESLIKCGDNRIDSGYRLSKELLLEAKPPDAVFAANAMMGFGVLKAVRELGLRCPDDVALAVYDDVPFGDVLRPRLTVVAQPAYEMGRLGAELLIRRIEGKEISSEPVELRLAAELIVRESTAPREA
jgi:LacI family transcriptional regulator